MYLYVRTYSLCVRLEPSFFPLFPSDHSFYRSLVALSLSPTILWPCPIFRHAKQISYTHKAFVHMYVHIGVFIDYFMDEVTVRSNELERHASKFGVHIAIECVILGAIKMRTIFHTKIFIE